MIKNDNNEWTSVPTGSLQRFAANLPADRQQRDFQPYAVGVVLALLISASVLGFSLIRGNDNPATAPFVSPAGPATASLTCEETQSLFVSYHDGSLADAKRQLVVAHLDYCGACQQAYKQQFGVSASIAGNPFLAVIFAHASR